MRSRVCLKTLLGGQLGLCERLVVGFVRRNALMRRGSAASIRSHIHVAATPAECSDGSQGAFDCVLEHRLGGGVTFGVERHE